MVLKLFILSFYECSKIVHLYPLKFFALVFSLLFSFTRHCTWIGNAYSQPLTAVSLGEKRLPFISGYKKFITSHKIFTLPIVLTFIKIRYMHKTQSTFSWEEPKALYKDKETRYKNRHLCHIRIIISVHLASYSNENKPLSVLLYPS